ncbi:MAG TPA: hypothetical protein VI318_24335 [Baekduia sp.]
MPPNSWIDLDTRLDPWPEYAARDAIDIATLDYRYGPGSLDELATPPTAEEARVAQREGDGDGGQHLHVAGIDRGKIRGSFLITAFADVDGERTLIGSEAVLSRWHVEGCANCQTHLLASAAFPLRGLDPETVTDNVEVILRTRDGRLTGNRDGLHVEDGPPQPRFRVGVR